MRNISILNGPNLNRLGTREPDIYGHETYEHLEQRCKAHAESLGLSITIQQSNFEGELVECIHDAIDNAQGIIINPAGLTFTSMPIMDALKMFPGPAIELHISNVHAREEIYHKSLMSPVVTAVIAGLGTDGYLHALDWMNNATAPR